MKESAEQEAGQDFVRLLEYLKTTRGFDFTGYKLSSLIRRVQKRMQQVDVKDYAAYLDFLEVHPDEFAPLFNTVLINVTDFFRDPAAWQEIAEQVLPRILEEKEPGAPIRCWSAGCASGEEAYTLAILLAEALGEQELRQRVKLYATDADEEALAAARQGIFPAARMKSVPEALLAKYFEPLGDRYVFRPDLRRALIFGRHDLVQDAAISRLDLLVCRNTLMYFNAETQAKILARFHFALRRNGYLFLGRAETLLTHSNSFRPLDLKHRIFQRTATASLRDRLLALSPASPGEAQGSARGVRLREAAFDAAPVAQIVVDRHGIVAQANERARQLFGLLPVDVGRALQDLEVSYRPVELRSHIDAAYAARTAVTVRDAEWRPAGGDGERRLLELQIVPLLDAAGGLLGVSVAFADVTVPHQLRRDLERTSQELETAFEELQSANEELETMNEELQATNEELRAVNDQVHERSEEVDVANVHLRSILASLRAAVVVLNRALQVEIWSDKAQELWGLRSDEVQGQPFLGLDIGLPVEQLRGPVLECLEGGSSARDVQVTGVNRRGRSIGCQVTCTPLGNGHRPQGVILLMEEIPPATPHAAAGT